jgi:ABC-type uncharacterized transport system permease subunit
MTDEPTHNPPDATAVETPEPEPEPAAGGLLATSDPAAALTEVGATHEMPESRFMRAVYWLTSANTFVVTVLSIFSALVIGAIMIVLANRDVMAKFGYFTARPGDALTASWDLIRSAYTALFQGAIYNPDATTWRQALFPISETLTSATPLIFTGLAVAVAFRGGLFNIGAQGQAVMGAIGAGLVGFEMNLPIVLHLILALLGGMVGGGIWGAIPGYLKAKTGAHEVIVTIMLNYIAAPAFISWLIIQKGVQDPNRSDAISKTVHSHANLPQFFPNTELRVNVGLLVGLLCAATMAWLINRSTLGFEVRAVGSNPDAARTAGMSVGRTYTLLMIISGALAGLGGASLVLGTAHALTGQVAGTIGFDGITVALLGRGKPWGVVMAAILFGALTAGGNRMQADAGVTNDIVAVLQAVIVIFIAAPALIKSIYRLRAARTARLATNLAKGW